MENRELKSGSQDSKVKNAAKLVSAVNTELDEELLFDCLDPVNKIVANKTANVVNDKVGVNDSWGRLNCFSYTLILSVIMLFVSYIVVEIFHYFVYPQAASKVNYLSWVSYSLKAIAVISTAVLMKGFIRMSDEVYGYSVFVFAVSLFLLFSGFGSYERNLE